MLDLAEQLLDMTSVSNGFINFEDQLRRMTQADRLAELRAEKAVSFLNRFE
ncbi:hypothetical protein D3C81_2269820 [compost metagenome]